MAKRNWVKGFWIGGIIGLLAFLLAIGFELIFKPHFPIYLDFPAVLILSLIPDTLKFTLGEVSHGLYNNLPLRYILGGFFNVLTYALIGLGIGGLFKKRK